MRSHKNGDILFFILSFRPQYIYYSENTFLSYSFFWDLFEAYFVVYLSATFSIFSSNSLDVLGMTLTVTKIKGYLFGFRSFFIVYAYEYKYNPVGGNALNNIRKKKTTLQLFVKLFVYSHMSNIKMF